MSTTSSEHVVTLQGDLDADEYALTRGILRPLLAAQTAIVDLRDVTYLDSRTIMIFFELKKGMRPRGGRRAAAERFHRASLMLR